jgi:hypothetical protein
MSFACVGAVPFARAVELCSPEPPTEPARAEPALIATGAAVTEMLPALSTVLAPPPVQIPTSRAPLDACVVASPSLPTPTVPPLAVAAAFAS